MEIMEKLKHKGTALKAASGVGLMALATGANADTMAEIGTKAAEAIAAFVVAVSAIGLAAISVIVAIQGFKMAFGMIRTIR